MARNIFSEDKGIIDDGFQNAVDVDHVSAAHHEDVRETCVPDGVIMLADCPYCGLQWKGIVKWVEVSGFFLGQVVPNTQATQAGVGMLFGCRKCNRASPITMTWPDVERYVAKAINRGWLPSTIHAARQQVMAERARQRLGQARR